MKRINFLTSIAVISMLLVFTSCEKESFENENVALSEEVSKELLNKLIDLNFNPNGVEKMKITEEDGTSKIVYLIEGDIMMTEEEIMRMNIYGGVQDKQYRTWNLINRSSITVVGDSRLLSQTARRALGYAVDNYNRLNLSFRINLRFDTRRGNGDIFVTINDNLGSGSRGQAGFPSFGRPYNLVWINQFANHRQSDQQLEHLLAHEIGHCVGLRHTDWNTRKSCGENSNEGTFGVGVVHIPGTPYAGRDNASIMNACYPNGTDGEWSYYDRVALNYLY